MTTRFTLSAIALAALFATGANAAERLTVTVSHTLDLARPAETMPNPWAKVNAALPQALNQPRGV